jgi:acyl-CoA thioester hydrolase
MASHVEKLRVRWVDTDASGIIHYTAAFRYFEVAEWELFRKVEISLGRQDLSFGFPRVSVNATFHAPLRADDEIAVHIRPERIGNTSVTFAIEIFREAIRCISGKVTAVFTNEQGQPVPIPEKIRLALTAE